MIIFKGMRASKFLIISKVNEIFLVSNWNPIDIIFNLITDTMLSTDNLRHLIEKLIHKMPEIFY